MTNLKRTIWVNQNTILGLVLVASITASLQGCQASHSSSIEGSSSASVKPADKPAIPNISVSTPAEGSAGGSGEGAIKDPQEFQFVLHGDETIRIVKNDILESLTELPTRSLIKIKKPLHTIFNDYRDASGAIRRTSNGFIKIDKILSAPQISETQLAEWNHQKLYISATVLFDDLALMDDLQPLRVVNKEADYFKNYDEHGRPVKVFTSLFQKRYGERFNLKITRDQLTANESKKWNRIFQELVNTVSREKVTSKRILFSNLERATQDIDQFESEGVVTSEGAWTKAVKVTAVKHGFPNVPCAEFASEILRQSYRRAGYHHQDDFNLESDNPLIWSNTASVKFLGQAVFKAGWIPWDTADYIPPVGALMLNAEGLSPGHAYWNAGKGGLWIVDNGSPRGRDLSVTSDATIKMMYQHGVFFLPPGILPKKRSL
jgi:hypothetical protein